MSTTLFRTASGDAATKAHLAAALRSTGAHDCDVLYLHSGMGFGVPAIPRKALLAEMWEVIVGLGVRTLCVPVFTFSFPNNEVFDPENTPSRMGTLGEFIRKQPGVVRSVDPLMSVALLGQDQQLVRDIGTESCGERSTFHLLSQREGVKFAFLGVRAGDCFTYMHHLEWQARVPYRYDRRFFGRIRSHGIESEATAILNVRYKGVEPNRGSYQYEELLLHRGLMSGAAFGDGPVRCVAERDATPVYMDLLRSNPNFFITEPFQPESADDAFEVNGVMTSM